MKTPEQLAKEFFDTKMTAHQDEDDCIYSFLAGYKAAQEQGKEPFHVGQDPYILNGRRAPEPDPLIISNLEEAMQRAIDRIKQKAIDWWLRDEKRFTGIRF